MKQPPLSKRYDLEEQTAGTIVEVVLSCINNVRLMDHANYLRYVEGEPFRSIGGRAEKSPIRLKVPASGHWHLVVDRQGFQALANSNVRTIAPRQANNSDATIAA
ncbi:uncharacterized protein DUF1883 [Hoeflea halophila]|uniref:Uncharacterized protein DUF1883 n=1 Tax=Hoeflea halophila TaxID=714899 RepID=A0A286HL64_9HYPH|nr:DUF1883 domain-containing protein [Hoeflea halophila]SOE08563.1 uncharacterized protein DUF1883 [Hoeflea halophila]